MKIGIDAGGTKTTASLFDSSGHVVKQYTTGFGNPLIDYAQAMTHIETAITTLMNECKNEKLKTLAIGVAGAEAGGFLEDMTNYFEKKFQITPFIMSDLKLSHIATFKGKSGTLLIAGTGSASLSRVNGNFYQKGGWGHILGDEGSGYWLGLTIMKEMMRYFENSPLTLDATHLIPDLLKIIPNRQTAIQLVYKEPKAKVAALAELIETYSDTAYVQYLMNKCVSKLVQLILSSLVEQTNTIVLGLEGSVVTKNLNIQSLLIKELEQLNYSISLVTTESATKGVLYL